MMEQEDIHILIIAILVSLGLIVYLTGVTP